MSETIDIAELEAQALSLPIDARASLAHRLLQSLEEVSEVEYERLWGEESARRASGFGSRPRPFSLGYESRPDPALACDPALAWATLNSDTSRAFDKPNQGRIAVKVINHLGDEVMKVFRVI